MTHDRDAECTTTTRGLNDEGKTDAVSDSCHDRGCAQLSECRLRHDDEFRDGNPGPGDQRGGDWFVECQTTPRRVGAHVIDVEGFEKVSQRTVLTGGAVQQGHDAVWTVLLQVGQQCGIDVGLGDVPIRSNVSQRVGDATAGAKRDIPLG